MGRMDEALLPAGVTPPHSDEAENSVLGAVLLDNAAWDAVGAVLRPVHFFRPQSRAVWATLTAMVAAGQPADTVTVYEAGGHDLAFLNALVQATPSVSRVAAYADIVLERWRERELIRIGADLAASALAGPAEGADASTLADNAVTRLMALSASASERTPERMDSLVVRYVEYVEGLLEGKGGAIATGLRDLDAITSGGIRPGELWVIGARPSMGKTAFTGTLVRYVAQQCGALFCSQEDTWTALVARHVAAAGRVNLADLRNPAKAPDSMWQGLSEGADHLAGLDLYLDDQSGLTLSDVRRKIQQTKRELAALGKVLRVVVVDYLQLMQGEGANRNLQLGLIANGLKGAAKELDVGIILLSQMNREADKRNGPPIMSDLRDSGDIEGAADLIGLLHREYMRNPHSANKRHAELHIVKQKNGSTGTVDLDFDGAFQRFSNWDGPPPEKTKGRAAHSPRGMD